ncbi:cytotoxic translational repressor of toxin-antitoxin stability system [Leifsonia sp. Leaf264]|uniref:cytotoxic translational repressor of toxin-antitoxin stability system n=1 Tax=Leifsonia sp. Leaf264 TaxID=1736314 RepID=UPI000A54E3E4|nr:cytotoxic translational repressor of toxin-antitoxin stability system [Leifsonia sp. Leaf264]
MVNDATGKAVGHHLTYKLPLDDGRVLRTRISTPVDKSTYGDSLWSAILRDQLEVTADVFWGCVNDGTLPVRSAPKAAPTKALPLGLIRQLQKTGLSAEDAAKLSVEQAGVVIAAYWEGVAGAE